MSLSTCMRCGGHIDLGPNETNRCEKCGGGSWATDEEIRAALRRKVALALDRWCSMSVVNRDLCADEIISIVRGEKP